MHRFNFWHFHLFCISQYRKGLPLARGPLRCGAQFGQIGLKPALDVGKMWASVWGREVCWGVGGREEKCGERHGGVGEGKGRCGGVKKCMGSLGECMG